MRSFRFPLDRTLKYRETQLRLREAAVSAAAARLASIESLRSRIEAEFSKEAERVPFREALALWAGYADRVRRQVAILERQADLARENLAAEQKRLMTADRDVRLIEELKEERLAAWKRESDREEAVVAEEAFLARWESGIIGRRWGA